MEHPLNIFSEIEVMKYFTTVLLVVTLGYFVYMPSILSVAVVLGVMFLRAFEVLTETKNNRTVLAQLEEVRELCKTTEVDHDHQKQMFSSRLGTFVAGANMFVTQLNAITMKLGLGAGLNSVSMDNFTGVENDRPKT